MRPAPSTAKIYILSILTLGFYFFYWCSKSRAQINQAAKKDLVPSTWYLAIPGLNYWWIWEYAGALELVSYKRIKSVDTFCFFLIGTSLLFLLPAFPNIGSHDLGRNGHEIFTVLLILFGIFIVINSIGLGFFCSTIQNKINKTSPNPPAPHIV